MSDSEIYSGTLSVSMTITGATSSEDGYYLYRLIASNSAYVCSTATSGVITLNVYDAISAPTSGGDDEDIVQEVLSQHFQLVWELEKQLIGTVQQLEVLCY
ncbi:MAG: hypothetical protein R2821_02275 [Flavobacteriaceae bacterium]